MLNFVLESLLISIIADRKIVSINGKFKNKYGQNPTRIIIYKIYRKLFLSDYLYFFSFFLTTTVKVIERIVFLGFLSAFIQSLIINFIPYYIFTYSLYIYPRF